MPVTSSFSALTHNSHNTTSNTKETGNKVTAEPVTPQTDINKDIVKIVSYKNNKAMDVKFKM